MASPSPKGSQPARPGAARMSSLSQTPSRRDDNGLKPPKRANTFHNGSPSERRHAAPDAFETSEATDNEDNADVTRASVELDDLPIELITLTDSFIESLTAKVHATPPNIDRLSQLFQEFYALASSHIATHVGALATRQSRDASPAPSASSTPSLSSAASRLRSKATSLGARDKPKAGPEQQMITAEELADRKRARRALVAKRGLLEEAVERRLCEGIYDRIYRHRSTQDEAQDDKLRSKTAALTLVGIGLGDLGVDTGDWLQQASDPAADMGDGPQQAPDPAADKAAEVRRWLGQARTDLTRMNQSRYPLGKLNHLKAAHKSIVDTLAHFHPSASADEIMPMLIYTLITMPPEDLHIMSDFKFIQYFRWEPKLTGEAAYCLTNLEAAISFLQTVDLATLRADEHPSGPPKSAAQPGVPRAETFPPAYPQGPTVAAPKNPGGEANPDSSAPSPGKGNPDSAATAEGAGEANPDTAAAPKPRPSPSGLKAPNVLRNRRLSDLVNTPAQAIGAASDAVFSTADQGLKTISSSLGDSYSFFLGKLRERQHGPKDSSIVVPRTLDDARKLVSTPPPDEDDSVCGADDADPPKRPPPCDDRVLGLVGGRRDASVDSAKSGRSASSSKKVLFADEPKAAAAPPAPSSFQSPAVLDQVRSLGSSFNPMARLSNIGMIRGFGRNTSNPAPPKDAKDIGKTSDGGDLASAFPDIAAALPKVSRFAPPIKRFMEVQSPAELRLGEVADLLHDYRRLAGALKSMGAFEDR